MFGGAWMPYGPVKSVTVTSSLLSGVKAWLEYEYPLLSGGFLGDDDGDGIVNGIEYAFSLDPLVRSTLEDTIVRDPVAQTLSIARPLPSVKSGVAYGAEWSSDLQNWSSAGVTVSTHGGEARATVSTGGGNVFLRWKITQQ